MDKLTFRKDWNMPSMRTWNRFPKNGIGGGPGGSFPPLLVLFQAIKMSRQDKQSAIKMLKAPPSAMVLSSVCVLESRSCLNSFWEISLKWNLNPVGVKLSLYYAIRRKITWWVWSYTICNLSPAQRYIDFTQENPQGVISFLPISSFPTVSQLHIFVTSEKQRVHRESAQSIDFPTLFCMWTLLPQTFVFGLWNTNSLGTPSTCPENARGKMLPSLVQHIQKHYTSIPWEFPTHPWDFFHPKAIWW